MVVGVEQGALRREVADQFLVVAAGLGIQIPDVAPSLIPCPKLRLPNGIEDRVSLQVKRFLLDRRQSDDAPESLSGFRVDSAVFAYLVPKQIGKRHRLNVAEAKLLQPFRDLSRHDPVAQFDKPGPATHLLQHLRVGERPIREAFHVGRTREAIERRRQARRRHRSFGGNVTVAAVTGMKEPGESVVEIPAHHVEQPLPEPRSGDLFGDLQLERFGDARPVGDNQVVEFQQSLAERLA